MTRSYRDMAWKEVITLYFSDFIEFFWPEVYKDIDWTKKEIALDKELLSLGNGPTTSSKYVDKLFQVFLNNGQAQWILLHIEVQHTKDVHFQDRMYVYHYRILDRYQKEVVSMAILADPDPSWRPNKYERKAWHLVTSHTYHVVKILDFQNQKEALQTHLNPFALVVLGQLSMIEKKGKGSGVPSLIQLTRDMLKAGWDRKKITDIHAFLHALFGITGKYELEYCQEVQRLEEEFGMQFKSMQERYDYERNKAEDYLAGQADGLQIGMERGVERGIERGMLLGKESILVSLLTNKFSYIPAGYQPRLKRASSDMLDTWILRTLSANSIEEVFQRSKDDSI